MFILENTDDYLDLVEQAIYESDELIACAGDEDGMDDMELTEMLPVYEALNKELKKLYEAIKSGNHTFADGKNLLFMPLVDQWKARIPFADILGVLNESHQKGLMK